MGEEAIDVVSKALMASDPRTVRDAVYTHQDWERYLAYCLQGELGYQEHGYAEKFG